MRHVRALVIFFAMLARGCAARFARLNAETKTPVEIRRVKLRWSNVYLLRGAKGQVALVDSGSPGDVESITRALEDAGRKPTDVHLVVLTHAHGDHAGLAKFFQKNGAKIVVGRGDEVLAKQGHNDPLHSTGLVAWMIKPLIDFSYEPFTPDVLVDDELTLESYGFPDVLVRRMPGHTLGSLVVLAGRHDALVGDVMLGGAFGGAINEDEPGEHYYQRDMEKNRCNLESLLDAGFERFYLGHGGPVTRDAVLRWREWWRDDSRKCAGSD